MSLCKRIDEMFVNAARQELEAIALYIGSTEYMELVLDPGPLDFDRTYNRMRLNGIPLYRVQAAEHLYLATEQKRFRLEKVWMEEAHQ